MLVAGDKDKRNDDNESFYDLLFSDEGDVPEAPAQEVHEAEEHIEGDDNASFYKMLFSDDGEIPEEPHK